jgi:hypothetical protein
VNNHQARRAAERFWSLGKSLEPFPRSLETSVYDAFDTIVVVRLPRLRLENVKEYFGSCGIGFDAGRTDRELRACLLARAGWGFIFLDGADPIDEQRYSFAHELAHFLLDHLWPRDEIIHRMGSNVIEVLNGVRLPTPNERIDAVLKSVKLCTFTHLIDRSPDGVIEHDHVVAVEDKADRLALELLAPRSEVIRLLEANGIQWSDKALDPTIAELSRTFGLPIRIAERYGTMLVRERRSAQSFRKWLE